MSKQFTLAEAVAYAAENGTPYSMPLDVLQRLMHASRSASLGPLQTLEVSQEALKDILWYEQDSEASAGYEYNSMDTERIDREKGIDYFSFSIVRASDGVVFGGEGARNRDYMWFGDWGNDKPVKLTEIR